MTISDNYTPLRQLGNGVTTQFSGIWAVLNSAYIRVYLESVATGVQTLQTLGVNYTLVFTASGFTVTFISGAPTNANYVVIGRSVSDDQSTPYTTSKGFQGNVEEDSFDKLTALTQDGRDAVNRSIKAPLGDTATMILPTAALRAGGIPYFDVSGNVLVGTAATLNLLTAFYQNASGNVSINRPGSVTTGLLLDVNGVLGVADGSAAAPSYTFAADIDTGFYRIGANQIGVTCNGGLIGTFNTGGLNTAIGATTPTTGAFTTVNASSSATAATFIPTSNTPPSNGLFLIGVNNVGISSNSQASFGISSVASAVNWLSASSSATLNNVILSSTGSDGTIGITISPKGGAVVSTTGINVTGSTVPANGIYLSAANTLGISANSGLVGVFTSTGLNNCIIGATTSVAGTFTALTATTSPTKNTASNSVPNMTTLQSSMLGGQLNKFRNATLAVWQRGTSITVTAGGTYAYTADGWMVSCTGANIVASQQVRALNSLYDIRLTGATSNTNIKFKQRIESILSSPLSGNQVTVQMKVATSGTGGITPTLTANYCTAQDNWGATTNIISAVSLQATVDGSYVILAYTFACPGLAWQGLEIIWDFGAFNSATKFIDIQELDIRATPGVSTGLNSNPPVVEMRNVNDEYTLCQRYLPALNPANGGTPYLLTGQCYSTTQAAILWLLPVQTRAQITGVTVSAASQFSLLTAAGGTAACTALAFAAATIHSIGLTATVAAGMVAGNATIIMPNNASAQILGTGAEL